VILIAIVAATVIADVARAQVFIDPESPSGKEYEIPLESVRRGAQPGADPSAPVTQGERNAVPFGEGITSDGAAAGSSDERDAPGRRRGGSPPPDPATSEIVEAAATNPGAPSGSTGSTLLYLGGGALVLALGAGGGLLLRRRRT
jgi:hypothetical protein